MSDQPGQPQNPYGQPLPPQGDGSGQGPDASQPTNPYGQQPPAYGEQPGQPASPYGQQPPAYGQQQDQAPYGQPAQGQSPYGQQQPYGAPAPTQGYGDQGYGAPGYGAPADPDRRPGTVTAGAWIAIVMSALGAAGSLLMAVVMVAMREPMLDELRRQPELDTAGVDLDSIVGLIVAVFVVSAILSVLGVVLGVFTLRRSNVARILLVVLSAITALLSLISIASGVSAVPMLAAIATIVLLFVGGANDWFARRKPATYGDPLGGTYGGSPYGG